MASILNATTTSGLVTSADNSGSLQLQTNNGTTAVTIDTSQNVGVGTTTINDRLVVQSSSAEQGITIRGDNLNALKIAMVNPGTNNDGVIGMKIANALRFITDNTERMRITSGGTVAINTTGAIANSGERLTVTSSGDTSFFQCSGGNNAGTAIHANRNSGTGNLLYFSYGNGYSPIGSINTNGTNTTYSTSSDYRLKENITPMTGALAKVSALKPCTYTWKSTGEQGEGFIAHELQAVVPDCVTGEKDAVDAEGNPVYQGIDTSFLVATLTAAIQELKAELDATKAEVQALKGVA